jgi:hypothetical protein
MVTWHIDPLDEDAFVNEWKWWAILKCQTCQKLALYEDVWNPVTQKWEPGLAFPKKLQAPAGVPVAVASAFEEALAAAQAAPRLAAVGIRRTLEAIALDQGAEGRTLRDQIKWLGANHKIPTQLADMMDISRNLGNLGAHFTEVNVTAGDVDTLVEFVLAVFEYIYVAPAKVKAFRQSVADRKA